MLEYTGTIVQNEQYKLKKMRDQLNQLQLQLASALNTISTLEQENALLKIKQEAAKPAAKPGDKAKKRGRKCKEKKPAHQRLSMSV